MQPDRIVIGCDDEHSKKILEEIYQFFPASKIFQTDIVTAELIKYGSNSFLATKIAFINELADLCEMVGANIKDLARAMGQDSRIGEKFLNPGPGFGGSCFPKDILALLNIAKTNNANLSLVDAVVKSNNNRKNLMVKKIINILDGDIKNKKIILLGLAFKANTDDLRESPSVILIERLLRKGFKVKVHDFEVEERKLFGVNLEIWNSNSHLAKNMKADPQELILESDLIVLAQHNPRYLEFLKNLPAHKVLVDLTGLTKKETK
jgi:UDPglucose 6-dehydrogenase